MYQLFMKSTGGNQVFSGKKEGKREQSSIIQAEESKIAFTTKS